MTRRDIEREYWLKRFGKKIEEIREQFEELDMARRYGWANEEYDIVEKIREIVNSIDLDISVLKC